MMDKKQMERLSSAFTLSDMEIFIFPELFFPLVLADIMSPILWEWKEDPWFKDIEKKSFNFKTNRIKQYIIDKYVFNLDLATWGLTTKETEVERFKDFFDMNHLRQANALFGYEGDKYYFDIDIRKHFGLDKFNTNVIPYWKTETIEAMTAFKYKEGFTTGAGECVSLSALYAAAMFVIGRIPLKEIFMIATPLHSQNFITEKEGLITNNRRIVTKNMWFNGTSLSAKARRALENEKVTIVSHVTGYIHTLLPEATINKDEYGRFSKKLREFLVSGLTVPIFINFLRFKSEFKSLFQLQCECSGIKRYIPLEKIFEYEHTSKISFYPETRSQLVKEVDCDEFNLSQYADRMMYNDVEDIINGMNPFDIGEMEDKLIYLGTSCPVNLIKSMINELKLFLSVDPKLPDSSKNYIAGDTPEITLEESRDEIIQKILSNREQSSTALYALYVYRQMDLIAWAPFIKAAMERNPTCYSEIKGTSIDTTYEIINNLPNESIYGENRLALPDEVWNFKRGDGIEKALLLANFIRYGDQSAKITVNISKSKVLLVNGDKEYRFTSAKSIEKSITIEGNFYGE